MRIHSALPRGSPFTRGVAGLLLSLALATGSVGTAAEFAEGEVRVHGFLTQGIVLTSDNNFLGDSEDGSLNFRELGLNLSWRPRSDVQLSAQLLARDAGRLDEGDAALDYAMLDWTPLSFESGRAGVRVGRVKNPFGLYNTTRDVAFTRPGAILPQSIYFEVSRNLELASDGIQFYAERYGEAGNLYVRAGVGYGQVDSKSTEAAFLGRDFPGHLDSNLLRLLNVTFEGAGGRYVLGFTSAAGSMDYESRSGEFLQDGRVHFRPIVFSAQLNREKWSLTAEHFLEYLRYRGLGALSPDRNVVAQSYYLQGTYRPAPKWETFLRYDVFYADRDDRDGRKSAALTGLPRFMGFAKDRTAGVRYDVTSQFMVRAEYHRIDGTAWLSSLENPDPMALERRWDMFVLLFSFRF